MSELVQLNILGRKRAVIMPDFAAREELLVAFNEVEKGRSKSAKMRVYAAAIGLCTGVGREVKSSYADHRFDILAYGGEVYSWLREKGLEPKEVSALAIPILNLVGENLFPSQKEVNEAKGNCEGSAAN